MCDINLFTGGASESVQCITVEQGSSMNIQTMIPPGRHFVLCVLYIVCVLSCDTIA